MSIKNSTGIIIQIATIVVFSVAAAAQQNQNQNPNSNQTNQTQNQPQNQQQQQQQPQKKKSLLQKLKDAQNAIQQGQSTPQQGGTVQQTGQQVQNGVQQGQNGAQQGMQGGQQGMQAGQQGMQGMQQGMQGGQQGASNGLQTNQASGAFSGGGGGAGACGPSCFDAGAFQANVSQMTMSQEGGWHIVRMNIQFHNSTNQPLIVAYHDGSMVMIDNNGNTYVPAGGNPGQLQGMGIDRGNQTDSQFVLGPGQTGNALFSVARGRGPNSPVGTGYTYNLTIDELQPQNGAMAIPVRTYNLNFPSLVPGTSNAAFASGPSQGSGFVGGGNGTSTAMPQGNVQSVSGQRGVGVPAQQQRIVNGRPAPGTTVQTAPTPVVKNAAMTTPVTTAKPSAAAVKPVPATTATKPTTATTPKKTTTPTTTTTTSK